MKNVNAVKGKVILGRSYRECKRVRMHREAKRENGPGAECTRSTFRKISVKTMRVSLYKKEEDKGGNACKTSFHSGCLFH